MKTSNLKWIAAATTLAAALVFGASAASAQIGTPDTFSEDPSDLAHLPISDLDDPNLVYADDMVIDGVAFSRGGTYVGNHMAHGEYESWGSFFTAGWAIPGMDGTTVQYLAQDGVSTMQPVVPADSIGFRYGAQWVPFEVMVFLTDGTWRVFEPVGANSGGEFGYTTGIYGWFGYSSGDPELKIESVTIFSGDRGIDDIQLGYSESNQTGTDCSVEGLAAAIDDTDLGPGLDQRLTTQAMQAIGHLQQNKMAKLIKDLEFMEFHIELERGDKIGDDDADALLDCIRALLEELYLM